MPFFGTGDMKPHAGNVVLSDVLPNAEELLRATPGVLVRHDASYQVWSASSSVSVPTLTCNVVRSVLPLPARAAGLAHEPLLYCKSVRVVVVAGYDSSAPPDKVSAIADIARALWLTGQEERDCAVLAIGPCPYGLLEEAIDAGVKVRLAVNDRDGVPLELLQHFPELEVAPKRLPYGYESLDCLRNPLGGLDVLSEAFREHLLVDFLPLSKTGILCGESPVSSPARPLSGRRARLLDALTFGCCPGLEVLGIVDEGSLEEGADEGRMAFDELMEFDVSTLSCDRQMMTIPAAPRESTKVMPGFVMAALAAAASE